MLEQFHFLEPLWFLALIPLFIIFWFAFQAKTDSKSWEKVVDPKLLPLLLQGEDKNSNLFPKIILAIAWLISVIALADPVWEKIPRPIFQTNAARVLVLDLSNSMLIDDLKPSRLARARFKIEDILSREEEGQTGLVLFAGEAFTASPLTRDTETIRSILKVLTPQIMPAQGSRADLGLSKAHELLKQSGIASGQVLLIADGVSEKSLALSAAKKLRNDGHSVSVMAVGTEAGGSLIFRNQTSVTVKLEAKSLNEIAESGGGSYHLISNNNSDLKSLLTPISDANALNNLQSNTGNEDDDLQNREWKSTGPLLILLLLPFAALAFRRGWLLNVFAGFVLLSLLSQSQEVLAADESPSIIATEQSLTPESDWKSKFQGLTQDLTEVLTKNKAQRIDDAFKKQQYQKALELSDDALDKGNAEYKLKDYEKALASFQQAEGADARYNEGNALAKLEKYEDAITAYDEALKLDSKMQDALDNKKAIEELLKQQQSDENKQASNENKEEGSQPEDESESDSQSDNKDQQSSNSKESKDQKDGAKSDENKEAQESDKDKQNQFSDANEDLEKNKEESEEEALQSAEEQAKNEKEKQESKSDKDKALAEQKEQAKENENKNSGEEIEQQIINAEELAEELNEEEKMAAEQWLRRIPDDPGGLLRRKFRHQFNLNRRNKNTTEKPW